MKAKVHTGSKTNILNAKLLNCTAQTDRTPFACCFCLENFKERVNTGARYPQKWGEKIRQLWILKQPKMDLNSDFDNFAVLGHHSHRTTPVFDKKRNEENPYYEKEVSTQS